MIAKTVHYTDFNGDAQSDTFYFHLSKAELLEWEMKTPGGYGALLQRISEEKDNAKIYDMFMEILLAGYGRKSDDGKRFIKDPVSTADFKQHAAFSELIIDLMTKEDEAVELFTAMVPSKADLDELAARGSAPSAPAPKKPQSDLAQAASRNEVVEEPSVQRTSKDISEMDEDELRAALRGIESR